MNRTTGTVLCMLLVLLGLMSACATAAPEPTPSEEEPVEVESEPDEATVEEDSRSQIVSRMIERADDLLEREQPAEAEATVDRALGIQPDHPVLWHQLARVRFQQNRFEAAETMAMRSLDFIDDDRELVRANWELIADARLRDGDVWGAEDARERARED